MNSTNDNKKEKLIKKASNKIYPLIQTEIKLPKKPII